MSYEAALPNEFRPRTKTAQGRRARAATWELDLAPKAAYTPIGYHITCVPDALHPWPLWQVRMIRRIYDPGFVPIFRRMVYRTPAGGTLEFIHHGVACFDREAPPDPIIQNAPLPYGWAFERPNVVARWFEPRDYENPGSRRALNNLPKHFVPWGDWVARWVEETYWEATAAEKTEYLETHGEHIEKRRIREHEDSEAAHADKWESKYRARESEKLTPEDRSYIYGLQTGQVKPETQPFVDIGTRRTA